MLSYVCNLYLKCIIDTCIFITLHAIMEIERLRFLLLEEEEAMHQRNYIQIF